MTDPADAGEIVAEHWGLDDPVGCLDPEQELETIELGDRVGWGLTICQGASIYGNPVDRERSMTAVIFGQVAEGARSAHSAVPAAWLPDVLRHSGSSDGEATHG